MKVLGREILSDFIKRHTEVRTQVAAWGRGSRGGGLEVAADVRARYPTVSFIRGRTVFNIKGNRYRLDTTMAFDTGIVIVDRMGTHAEYTKWKY